MVGGNTWLRNVAAGAGFVWDEVTIVWDTITDTPYSDTIFHYKKCHPTYPSVERYRNDMIYLLTAIRLTPSGSSTVQYSTHLHTNSTQKNTMKQYTVQNTLYN